MFEISKKKLQEMLEEEIRNEIKNMQRNAWNDLILYTYKELESEARNMYDSFIEQYYRYETKSYYRHHVGIGTGTGENLYYGKGPEDTETSEGISYVFDGEIDGFKMYKFYTNFSGGFMDGGYRYNTPDEVLNQVIDGIRGVPKARNGKRGWTVKWSGSYLGKYFNFTGTMRDAFNWFDSYVDDIKLEIFNNNKSKIMKKYFK